MQAITAPRSLQEIETEIRAHSQYVTTSIIAIGNALIEAKALLAHGEWEGWLTGRVNFSQRTANNFMRIAREIGNGSSLAALPYTKALALLDVPAEQREQVADEIDVNNKSAAAIRKAIADRDKAQAEKRSEEAARKRAEAEAEQAKKLASEAMQARDHAAKLTEQYSEKLAEAQAALTDAQNKPLPTITTTVAPDDYEEYKAKAAQADTLRKRAEEAERYAIAQETAAKNAQASMRRAQAEQIERDADSSSEPFSATKMAEAVQTFMAAMGTIPNLNAYFFGLSENRLAAYRPYLAAMRAWVEGAESAINQPGAIKAEAIVGGDGHE